MNKPIFLSLLALNQLSAWVINSQSEWEKSVIKTPDLAIEQGTVASKEKRSVLVQSVTKTFEQKKSATGLIVDQIPDWLNWEPTSKIIPKNLKDAPVFLQMGPKNYWVFGRYQQLKGAAKLFEKPVKLEGYESPVYSTPDPNQFNAISGRPKNEGIYNAFNDAYGGYHAWHSRDMKRWVHYGKVSGDKSKWMTTAESLDGVAYLYYDFPNDQDPHLLIDADLKDGELGENVGLVFNDPSDGSDCVVIRGLNGTFNLIAEDWSPINAKTHSYDSPLAIRATSKDGGKTPFEVKGYSVDERTQPTGIFKTYKHPHWAKDDPARFPTGIAKYEVHKPKQDAYGDWAAIAIGGQYYLFGDYHPKKGRIKTGWFTASSVDEKFRFCGSLGKGHPDPDIMFAEGKFYLATQCNSDSVSTGPWVESVEARVGVDTNKDGEINQWTDWENISESYDYIDGFSKQVAKTKAKLDLSGLPKGYGFKFELRLTDKTKNVSKPVIKQVEMTFAN